VAAATKVSNKIFNVFVRVYRFLFFFFYFFGGYCSSSLGSLGIFLRQFVGKAIKILEAPRQMVFNDL